MVYFGGPRQKESETGNNEAANSVFTTYIPRVSALGGRPTTLLHARPATQPLSLKLLHTGRLPPNQLQHHTLLSILSSHSTRASNPPKLPLFGGPAVEENTCLKTPLRLALADGESSCLPTRSLYSLRHKQAFTQIHDHT